MWGFVRRAGTRGHGGKRRGPATGPLHTVPEQQSRIRTSADPWVTRSSWLVTQHPPHQVSPTMELYSEDSGVVLRHEDEP